MDPEPLRGTDATPGQYRPGLRSDPSSLSAVITVTRAGIYGASSPARLVVTMPSTKNDNIHDTKLLVQIVGSSYYLTLRLASAHGV